MKIYCNKREASLYAPETMTSGSVGMTVEFGFSADWDGLTKTAVFTDGTDSYDVILTDASCVIPHELFTTGARISCGVYGTDGDNIVIPTVYCSLGLVRRGADPTGDESTDPTLPVYAQLAAELEDKQDKLVAGDNITIQGNVISATGGGGGGGAVDSVNGKTGVVVLDATDVGAAATNHTHSGYAAADHNHDGVYQPAGSYASADHNHDGVYLTQHQDISGKLDASHIIHEMWEFTTEDDDTFQKEVCLWS